MELINSTRLIAGYSIGREPSGRDSLLVLVKGTFRIPMQSDHAVRLDDEQVPFVTSDVFYGEPGLSSPKYEVDYALRKGRCDLLLNASAYAPGGAEARRVEVSVRVGSWSKSLAVVGDRVWEAGGPGIGSSSPIPFSVMPISYDRAFGGTDCAHPDSGKHSAFLANPVGRGFHSQNVKEWIDGTPLPNTEEIDQPVSWISGSYRPMAFGPIGRQWEPRVGYAGTYDQNWIDNVFPFLPGDFDERYYQSAPPDQQLSIPLGEQQVSLVNLTPDGERTFALPHFIAPVHVFPKRGEQEDLSAVADTIILEPDLNRLTMTWRVSRPLRRDLFEIDQVLVGKKGSDWWQAREEIGFPISVLLDSLRGKAVTAETSE